jgi:hypothetical protein
VPTSADIGYRVVSATDPHSRNLGFPDPGMKLYTSNFVENLQAVMKQLEVIRRIYVAVP